MFISVHSIGGIITNAQMGEDFKELVRKMHEDMEELGFDREDDDARIFDSENNVVYSFPDDAYSFLLETHEKVEFVEWFKHTLSPFHNDKDIDVYKFKADDSRIYTIYHDVREKKWKIAKVFAA